MPNLLRRGVGEFEITYPLSEARENLPPPRMRKLNYCWGASF